MTAIAFATGAMQLLAPGRDHHVLADAIVQRAEAEAPLFKGDDDRHRTVAYLVAVAFRESSLIVDIVGDHGRSFCAFQIHQSSGGTPALRTDAGACVAMAFDMLRTSMRVCAAHPLAWYAEGPNGCASPRAQRLSRDRMALAAWLVRSVK